MAACYKLKRSVSLSRDVSNQITSSLTSSHNQSPDVVWLSCGTGTASCTLTRLQLALFSPLLGSTLQELNDWQHVDIILPDVESESCLQHLDQFLQLGGKFIGSQSELQLLQSVMGQLQLQGTMDITPLGSKREKVENGCFPSSEWSCCAALSDSDSLNYYSDSEFIEPSELSTKNNSSKVKCAIKANFSETQPKSELLDSDNEKKPLKTESIKTIRKKRSKSKVTALKTCSKAKKSRPKATTVKRERELGPIRTATGVACGICSASFPTEDEAKSHMSFHTGENRFGCHLCQYRSTSVTYLKRHFQRQHNAEKAFKCDSCTYSNSDIRNFSRHQIAAHGKLTVNSSSNICPQCGHVARGERELRTHYESVRFLQ